MKKALLVLAVMSTSLMAFADISIGIGPGGISIGHDEPGRGPGNGPGRGPGWPPGNGPGHGPGWPGGRSKVCFYRDSNFRGDSFCVRPGQEESDLRRTGWNDAISSIEIQGDVTVDVYQNINYSGLRVTIDRSIADLRQAGFMWNDFISSYTTSRDGGGGGNNPPPPPPNRGRVCFFENVNYSGNSFCLRPGEYRSDLSSWNDKISSISVEGDASVYLYEDVNYRGRDLWIERSTPDLRGLRFNDAASAVNVVNGDGR